MKVGRSGTRKSGTRHDQDVPRGTKAELVSGGIGFRSGWAKAEFGQSFVCVRAQL